MSHLQAFSLGIMFCLTAMLLVLDFCLRSSPGTKHVTGPLSEEAKPYSLGQSPNE
jgi:hypothetical protein